MSSPSPIGQGRDTCKGYLNLNNNMADEAGTYYPLSADNVMCPQYFALIIFDFKTQFYARTDTSKGSRRRRYFSRSRIIFAVLIWYRSRWYLYFNGSRSLGRSLTKLKDISVNIAVLKPNDIMIVNLSFCKESTAHDKINNSVCLVCADSSLDGGLNSNQCSWMAVCYIIACVMNKISTK